MGVLGFALESSSGGVSHVQNGQIHPVLRFDHLGWRVFRNVLTLDDGHDFFGDLPALQHAGAQDGGVDQVRDPGRSVLPVSHVGAGGPANVVHESDRRCQLRVLARDESCFIRNH